MAAKRFYYSDTIADFLTKSADTIIGEITRYTSQDINKQTSNSWREEISLLQTILTPYTGRGSVFFEYNIPRMGRRADVILLIDGLVFVLEFKTAEQAFTRDAELQVWDYALDLKNFQEGCRDRILIPILIAPSEKNRHCQLDLVPFSDNVYRPLLANATCLPDCLTNVLARLTPYPHTTPQDDLRWAISGYDPTPTIIEAAVALYEHHTVEEITRHDGEIELTAQAISRIIDACRTHRRKAVCFVTGVPGAGKTLIGLQTAIEQYEKGEKAVYLSGNFPLVEVLQEALARDYVRRSKEDKQAGRIPKACTKVEARSEVKTFIQMIHHYRDLYLEGTEIRDGGIYPIPGYFRDRTDKAYIPTEHVAIFDEAQRAWTKDELARFMREKKHITDFPYSEPDYLLSCMDRQIDWGLVICLIGGGQEINKGEAGITEWIESINRHYRHWDIYMSDRLTEKEYADGQALSLLADQSRLHIEPALHLAVSMRSFRAEKLSLFVHHLLELNQPAAATTLAELSAYPIYLTRSLDSAKTWLRQQARGNERYGILASSKAERLKAISVNVRYKPDFVHWFLADESDIRSSNALEDTLTEFEVQGLEIDWSCVVWDADLRLNKDHTAWQHYQLRGGTNWQNIHKEATQAYQLNAYRVLLTRARQGMIIVVPEGDHSIPPDTTRNPEWYDNIYRYLCGIGIPKLLDNE